MSSQSDDLHQRAIIIDGHSDILMPIADGKMRLSDRFELPDPAVWQAPPGWRRSAEADFYDMSPHTDYFQTMGHYDIPRFLDGGLTAQAMAVFIDAIHLDRPLHRALEMIHWLRREAGESPDFSLITSADDIRAIKASGKTGGFLSFEGFEPLESDLKLLDIFHALGLRMASLTHSRRNFFADGTQPGVKTGGLTIPGKAAVKRMNKLGIVIDLAHLNLAGCWDVVGLTDAPIVLSHCSPRRNFPDDPTSSPLYPDLVDETSRPLMEAIAKTGGVIGIIAYNQPTLDAYLDDIEAALRAVGPNHVGLGTDFFGLDSAPTGFTGMHELPNVTRGLIARGHSDETILKILGENYLRVFREVWS